MNAETRSTANARTRRHAIAWWLMCLVALAHAACRDPAPRDLAPKVVTAVEDPWAPKPEPASQDYADARRAFTTQLLRKQPAPQSWNPLSLRPDAAEIESASAGRTLKAWVSKTSPAPGRQSPAVLFLHGGFAFAEDDWDMSRPFRDAGYVVLTPILRGENGASGVFSLFYDEVEDVLAAADVLAKRSDVDPRRIYISGHSAGGVLAMLASMTSTRFRAMSSLSGIPDATALAGETAWIPFDPNDANELRMRSPAAFPKSFKCPARLFWGDEETWLEPSTRELARRARAAGLDVDASSVPGDHSSMTGPAITRSIEFFAQHP